MISLQVVDFYSVQLEVNKVFDISLTLSIFKIGRSRWLPGKYVWGYMSFPGDVADGKVEQLNPY